MTKAAVGCSLLIMAIVGVAAAAWLWWLARARGLRRALTWDCGYAAPTARMQYTSSSFAHGLVSLYGWALRPKIHRPSLGGPFASAATFSSHVPDVVLDRLLVPAAQSTSRGLGWFRWVQRGSVHAYLIYILATLVWLMLWQRGR